MNKAFDEHGKAHYQRRIYTAGRLKHGWALQQQELIKKETLDGLNKLMLTAFFLYLKIDKMWGKHLTSLTGFGAPQTHVDRSYKRGIADYDTNYAKKHWCMQNRKIFQRLSATWE
ncbi:MAG: hypothetical protein U0Z17_07070 [Bacteroidales bacterium]